jgi:hypothetical protein
MDEILAVYVRRLAKQQIKKERAKRLKTCLFNEIVRDTDIDMFKYLNELEKACDGDLLNNKMILLKALWCCEDVDRYLCIDTNEMQKMIATRIEELTKDGK